MKVMFDHQIFVVQAYGGYSKYYVALARALRTLPGIQTDIVAPAHVNEYLLPSDSHNGITFRLRHLRRGLKYRPLLAAPLVRASAVWCRPDIVHETHSILRGGHLPRGIPVMATCHDMTPERLANGSPASRAAIANRRLAFERAAGIVCISDNTRTDLLRFYPQLESRISVVHHGVDKVQPLASLAQPLPPHFLLFVGMRSGYKNFANALRALGASALARGECHLLCFGGGPLTPAERQCCADAGLRADQVSQLSGDDAVLAYLYQHAAALIYPSLYEGFGMPLTEAMVQGCPVLCSQASCFPEICGDAALYFDPNDTESMRQAIDQVLGDTACRDELIRRGHQRVAAFTWQACAAGTALAYERALASAGPHH